MNSGHIRQAIARHINWRQGSLIPEAVVQVPRRIVHRDGNPHHWTSGTYLADLMWVTRDLYATEIEIKVSRADWRADLAKDKWHAMPPWVARFIYAVPERLGIPEWVPPQAGIWHVYTDKGGVQWIRTARAPKRIGKEKVPQVTLDWWRGHLYYRFWNNVLHGPLPKLPPDLREPVAA